MECALANLIETIIFLRAQLILQFAGARVIHVRVLPSLEIMKGRSLARWHSCRRRREDRKDARK
jgi:hypothetical protein